MYNINFTSNINFNNLRRFNINDNDIIYHYNKDYVDPIYKYKKGYKIKIKKQNKGKFTEYCNGKVTQECIQKGKNSFDPIIRKRAVFAQNSRKWKH